MISLQGQSQIITKDEVLTLERQGEAKFVDGKFFKETGETLTIKGNVQPLDGRELLLVPEGDRFKEQYNVFTAQQILVNDIVARCGVRFQVQNVEAWGSYFMARIMRIDVGPNENA